jgi:hypothetical protein
VHQWRFREGAEVVGADNDALGDVAEILPNTAHPAFLRVRHGRLHHTDYYVPITAIANYDGDTVYLNVSVEEAKHRGWTAVPVMPTDVPRTAPAPIYQPPPPPTTPPPMAVVAPPRPLEAVPPPVPARPLAPEPSVNDLRPMFNPGVEHEPMLLLDTTGSMSYAAADGSKIQRREVIGEAIGRIVEKLAAADSQAAEEAAAGEDAGGLMTVTFAGGSADCIDDLNPGNWRQKWNRIEWGGGTQIMPGWNLLVETYLAEFGEVPKQDRPHMLALVITDGEADDTDQFAQTLAQARGGTYVCMAVLGFGPEHDRALAAYQRIAAANDHVRVVTFGSETDPDTIADGVLSLIG